MKLRPRRLLIRGTCLLVRGLFRLFGGFRVSGLEHVPAAGGAILAPNHRSWADPPAMRCVIRRSCWFMGNDFLFRIPVLGKLIPLYGAFPVERGKLDREALRIAEGHLKDGDLVCVFPEGGTTVTGWLFPFEGGVALMALRTGMPIVPVGITGTDKVLPMVRPVPRYHRGGVTVTFGPPIHPDEIDPSLPRRERVDLLTQRLYEAVAALLPPEYGPQPKGDATAEPARP
jgi:1-acyl-sn-glycerol-3-phosphate acyltransferase